MAEQEQQKPGWREQRREKKRSKKRQSGAPPQKNAERPRTSDDASVTDTADRPVLGDITIAGGF